MKFEPDVDVVVGVFYGDEGKGQVAKYMADKASKDGSPYRWSARVGAQNAEHRIIHGACDLTCRVFPSACAFRRDIVTVLGAGHCFMPEHFFREAVHLGIDMDNVRVDPHAMWLKASHAKDNLDVANARGSTGWGVGAAIAEKVRRDPETKLIGDCEEMRVALKNRFTDVPYWIQGVYGPGLVEGSQGTMLSLDHGHYPYCTSKNVTAPAVCAELGIGLKRVRSVVGVARLVMMRVPGPSGPTGGTEISFDEVESRTGMRIPQSKRSQSDASLWDSRTDERLFDMSIGEIHRSHILNNFDKIAVTFADYHRAGNYRATEWDQLHPETQSAIKEIEQHIAPVFLIRTGQGEHDFIER